MTTDPSPRVAGTHVLLNGLLDPLFTVDANWRYTFVNHHAAAILRATPEALLGRVLWEWVPDALGTALSERYRQVMVTREAAEFELHDRALGVWLEVRAFPYEDGIAVHSRDVTARRLADERRERTLEVTRALAAASTVPDVARAALHAGLPALGAYGGTVLRLNPDAGTLDVVHTEGYGARAAAWRSFPLNASMPITDALRTGETLFLREAQFNARYPELVGADGSPTRAMAVLPLQVNAETLGVLALSFDMDCRFNDVERNFAASLAGQLAQALARAQLSDDRERHLAALHQERALHATVLAQMPVAIWIAEVPGGRLIAGNNAIRRVLGHDFLPSRAVQEYDQYVGFHPDGRRYESHEWPLARTVLSGETIEDEEIEMLRGDGTRAFVSYSSAIIRHEDGRPVFAVVIGVDVTARHAAEAALRELNEELEARVLERTRESEATARHLRGLNEELEAFSYSVSHDLRTPLRHIQGFVGLLRRTLGPDVDARAARHLNVVESSAARMNTLIEELLAFARTSRQALQWQDVPLQEVLEEARANLAPELQERQVRWAVEALPTVRGDRAMLRQVFTNLLSNALKYSRDREEARVEVRARREGPEWVFSVQVNGVGFDSQYAARLFGAFQRLHRQDEFEGTGVGLANVRRVIARHEGRTWAEGRPGEGATFSFTLPA